MGVEPAGPASVVAGASEDDMIAFGREVANVEASALSLLARTLDSSFAAAVSLILGVRGRVIVSGMGKSGHVGRKIAATLASTGSPALFIHPAEASHGDLGMLIRGDILIALSNSGATAELMPIVRHANALGVPIVGIAGQRQSPLMRDADVQLVLPHALEACPANVAPTTSTTLMMALGDALAIAAMRTRGMSRDGLQALHPGGNIGRRLRLVSAIMHPVEKLPLVQMGTPMRETIPTMTTASFGVAGVLDDAGRLVGIITDGDLRRNADQLLSLTAAEVMTAEPTTILSTELLGDALALMRAKRITSLFVLSVRDREHGRPIGLVHIHDLLRLGL